MAEVELGDGVTLSEGITEDEVELTADYYDSDGTMRYTTIYLDRDKICKIVNFAAEHGITY